MNDLEELYTDVLIDHGNHPRNFRKPEQFTCVAHGYNPLCGDDFYVYVNLQEGLVRDIAFEGEGCAISTASASLMTQVLMGMAVDDVQDLLQNVRRMLTTDDLVFNAVDEEPTSRLSALSGVKRYPMRVKCATLAWHTLHAALENQQDVITTE